MLETRIVTSEAGLNRLTRQWEKLLTHAVGSEVVMAPSWLAAWWKVFGQDGDRSIACVTVWDNDELVGLLPLLRRSAKIPPGLPYWKLETLGTGEDERDEIFAEYAGLIAVRER